MKMKKAYFLIVLFLCGLSVGNLFAAAPAADRLGQQLIDAAREGNEPEVERLIARGADVDAVNMNGRTALMHAASNGNTDIVKLLLQEGANVNVTVPTIGYTALMYAVFSGDPAIVELLLDKGADRNIKDRFGKTAEDIAREFEYENLANMIRDYTPRGRTVKRAVTGPDKNYM